MTYEKRRSHQKKYRDGVRLGAEFGSSAAPRCPRRPGGLGALADEGDAVHDPHGGGEAVPVPGHLLLLALLCRPLCPAATGGGGGRLPRPVASGGVGPGMDH